MNKTKRGVKRSVPPPTSTSTTTTTAPIAIKKVSITNDVEFEFLMRKTEKDIFVPSPIELAKPLQASQDDSIPTYLVQAFPSHYFGLLFRNKTSKTDTKQSFGVKITIDQRPVRCGADILPAIDPLDSHFEAELEVSEFEMQSNGKEAIYSSFQFASSEVVEDENQNSLEQEISQVGTIDVKIYPVVYARLAESSSISTAEQQIHPLQKIKIQQIQTKEKAICVVSGEGRIAEPIQKVAQFKVDYEKEIAHFQILYRDDLGLINERKKRGMEPIPTEVPTAHRRPKRVKK